jgi:formylglycine-generating enzyme required for sulfatase activity
MSVHITCPHCQCLLEAASQQSLPTHCPQCHQWVTCPKCHSTQPADQQTLAGRCPHCNSELTVGRTLTLDNATALAEDILPHVPGFDMLEKLEAGGMGIVYRARQHNPAREVAIKVLLAHLARNSQYLERFKREANIASTLSAAHLLPVHSVETTEDGRPAVVMPYIEGADLATAIRARRDIKAGKTPEKPHPWQGLDDRAFFDRMLLVLDQAVAAVAALHENKVLHRDIKPHNILLDKMGNAWLADFGLARLADDGTLTQGIKGTVAYAPPEQADPDREVDWHSDVFSLGATLYQALTLELPFGKPGSAHTVAAAASPRLKQPLIPLAMDAVIAKALELEPAKRHQNGRELREDWEAVRKNSLPPHTKVPGLPKRIVKPIWVRWRAVAAAGLVLLSLGGGALLRGLGRDPQSPAPPAPERRAVRVVTNPPGARVALVPLDPVTGLAVEGNAVYPAGTTPVTVPDVPTGDYLVEAVCSHGFHQVYRTVPTQDEWHDIGDRDWWFVGNRGSDGVVNLTEIVIPRETDVTKGMVPFKGAEFTMGPERLSREPGPDDQPAHRRVVADFYLDPTEVSVGEYRRLKSIPRAFAQERPTDSYAVRWVTYYHALEYAERIGKRLPDEVEFEYAATNRGTTRFPWGNEDKITQWDFGPVKTPVYDRTPTNPPVYGLFSNVAEWTSSRPSLYPGLRPDAVIAYEEPRFVAERRLRHVVRGAAVGVVQGQPEPLGEHRGMAWEPRCRFSSPASGAYAGIGFRCARSASPQFVKP